MDNRKVLILEDDETLSQSLVVLLKKKNIDALVTSNPVEARDFLNRYRVVTMFVDCLLPSESGPDFVQSIRRQHPKEMLDVILMSGVFTDANFVRDSMRDTDAIHFLKKPFANDEVLKFFNSWEAPVALNKSELSKVHPRQALYKLFSKPQATEREKRKAIESLEDIYGFDLPLIYQILVRSKLSGHLNIVSEKGDVSGVTFADGEITSVDIVDKETILGKLLIESGYLLPEDLDKALSIKNTKKLGEKLVSENLVSPHGFNAVLANQMSLRLSRTIVNENVKVNFVPTEVELTVPSIDRELFENFLHDWIASKITLDWFRAHYAPLVNERLSLNKQEKSSMSYLSKPLVASLSGLIDACTNGHSIGELLDSNKFDEHMFYKAIHFLLTVGSLVVVEGIGVSPEERLKVLKKMSNQIIGQSQLNIFNVIVKMTGVPPGQFEVVKTEFLKLLGESSVSDTPEYVDLHKRLQLEVVKAIDFLKVSGHERLRDEILKTEVEMKLKASSQFDEAKNLLQKSQFKDALQRLQKAIEIDSTLDKVRLYLIWAKLGSIEPASKLTVLKEVEFEMLQISPEDKFDSLFNFVMGLYAKARGDNQSAKRSFEKAVAMDNSMIVARRELTVLSSLTTGKTDLLNSDLKSLVGSLFKKSAR